VTAQTVLVGGGGLGDADAPLALRDVGLVHAGRDVTAVAENVL